MKVKEVLYYVALSVVLYGTIAGIDNGIGFCVILPGTFISVFLILKITPKE